MKLPDEIQKMFQEFEQDTRQRILDAAKADPKKHKLTTVMGKASTSYTFYEGGKNKRGDKIYFCVADYVNVAGYVLTWRQVYYKKPRKGVTMQRDQWAARISKGAAVKLAQARAAKCKVRYA